MTDLPANWTCLTAHLTNCLGGLVLNEKATGKQRKFGLHEGVLSTWIPGTDIMEQAGPVPEEIWLRVTCSGSSYLMAWSADGTNWTQIFDVESLKKSDWNTYHHDQWAVENATLADSTVQPAAATRDAPPEAVRLVQQYPNCTYTMAPDRSQGSITDNDRGGRLLVTVEPVGYLWEEFADGQYPSCTLSYELTPHMLTVADNASGKQLVTYQPLPDNPGGFDLQNEGQYIAFRKDGIDFAGVHDIYDQNREYEGR